MTDPNQYVRRCDVEKILGDMIRTQNMLDTLCTKRLAEADVSTAEIVMQERTQLASRIRKGELATAKALIDLTPGFTYKRFLDYDGTSEYFAMVANDADRVPLVPVKADEAIADAA